MTTALTAAPIAYVTDGGLETDLIFHHGVDLPQFAAYPLLTRPGGRDLLRAYYLGYADVARRAGAGLLLETPTWRANPDWGARLGHDAAHLDAVNRDAVAFARDLAAGLGDLADVRVVGMVGPRGDGYAASEAADPEDARAYHAPQVRAFAAAGADAVAAYTLTGVAEAVGVCRAAAEAGLPAAVSFTVEVDGRLPDGTPLGDAVARVDADAAPAHFLVNCAHPEHIGAAVDGGDWQRRIAGVRANASRLSHAELDAADALDEGDPEDLARCHRALAGVLPGLRIVGGCCGTDVRHVAALWGVVAPADDLAALTVGQPSSWRKR